MCVCVCGCVSTCIIYVQTSPSLPLSQTYTGDTIVESSSVASAAQRELERSDQDGSTTKTVEIGTVNVPPPVFFCSVEPASAALQKGTLFDTEHVC